MPPLKRAGGWSSIGYALRKARESGGTMAMWRAMRTRNTCKTCALGMGGQAGGMVNESGHFPEFCKKSLQAMAADMQPAIESQFWSNYTVGRLKQASSRELERFGRLSEPVQYTRSSSCYTPVSWDEALGVIASKLASTSPDETFFYSSGRSSNEAGFLLHLFARLYGTNNINNCSYYCHQASGVGMTRVIGSGTATVVLEDLDKTDLVFVIGANPASNHPRLMRALMNVRRRGGQVIIINPIREPGLEVFSIPSDVRSLLFTSKIASLMVQPHIGGDLALLMGVAKSLVENGQIDYGFLTRHTEGFEALLERVRSATWNELVEGSGVERTIIEDIASRYAASKRTIFSWAMGITHHRHGTETVQMIAALALLRGMIGQPGSGLMPIRGHSNVQGVGSVGMTPELNRTIFEKLTSEYQLQLPDTPGLDTMGCMEAAASGQVKVGICLGGNLYGSNPDQAFSAKALSRLDLLVTLSTTLNTGHAWALARQSIILPVLPRDEEPQPTSQESMFNYVRLSEGGEPRMDGPRSEVAIIAELAARVSRLAPGDSLNGIKWADMNDTEGIRDMISRVVPGWQRVREMNLNGQEFHVEGRTLHQPVFNTPNGRARFQTVDLPGLAPTSHRSFRLMTIRSEGQFNTVVYEDYDLFRGAPGRDVVLIHPDDLNRLGLADGQRVAVEGPAGRLPHFRVMAFERIRTGNIAMYFPEANVLLNRDVDRHSRTPAFKGGVVTIST